jgi:hypothetical protein
MAVLAVLELSEADGDFFSDFDLDYECSGPLKVAAVEEDPAP